METLQGVELTGTNRPCGLITIIFTVFEMGTLKGFPYPPAMVRCRRSRQAPHAGEDGADSRLRESRSKLGERARLGFYKRARSSRHQKISGGNSGGATPDPISNSEVKPSRADGTAGETLWESRSPPGLFSLVWEPSEGSHTLPRWCAAGTAGRLPTRLIGEP